MPSASLTGTAAQLSSRIPATPSACANLAANLPSPASLINALVHLGSPSLPPLFFSPNLLPCYLWCKLGLLQAELSKYCFNCSSIHLCMCLQFLLNFNTAKGELARLQSKAHPSCPDKLKHVFTYHCRQPSPIMSPFLVALRVCGCTKCVWQRPKRTPQSMATSWKVRTVKCKELHA